MKLEKNLKSRLVIRLGSKLLWSFEKLIAKSSILAPGKEIPEHRAVYNVVTRYHLGLKGSEPKENCCIQVNGEYRHWEEGKSFIFDDTYRHSVLNDTYGERVVLFMDIVRPLKLPVSSLN